MSSTTSVLCQVLDPVLEAVQDPMLCPASDLVPDLVLDPVPNPVLYHVPDANTGSYTKDFNWISLGAGKILMGSVCNFY